MKRCCLIILFCFPFFVNAQIISTIAGEGSGSDGGPALTAAIYDPAALVFDNAGNLYFSEELGNKVRKINISGVITTIAGTGSGGYSGDGGLAVDAELNQPIGLATDTLGNLFIAEAANHVIRKVDVSTGLISTVCGNGSPGFSGDGGLASLAVLNGPCDVKFDTYGNLYIACLGSIRKINTSGIINTIAGVGTSYGDSGDGGLATDAEIEPCNISIDTSGNIYMSDDQHLVIRKINIITNIITHIAGDSSLGIYNGDDISALSAHIDPEGLILSNTGLLYIGDRANNRVRMIDIAGIIHTIAGDGIAGTTGDGEPANSAEIDWPAGLVFDRCGNLYIAQIDEPRIRKVIFDSTGTPAITISPNPGDTVCAGTSVTYLATVTGSSTSAYKWLINGTVVSTTGSTYTYTPINGDSVRCVFAGTGLCSGHADTVSSNTVHMVVAPFVTPTVTLSGAATAVLGSTVTVTAIIAGAGSSYSINWYDNGVLFATTTTPMVTYTVTAGTDSITATVIPSGGCYDSATSAAHTITSSNEGVINITASPVSIYPNPAHNQVIISGSDIANITITNPIGQTLLSKNTNEAKLSIDISSYPAGVYLIKVTDSKGGKTVSKIVKK